MTAINTLRDGRETRHRLPLQGSIETNPEQTAPGRNAGIFSLGKLAVEERYGSPRHKKGADHYGQDALIDFTEQNTKLYSPQDEVTGVPLPWVIEPDLPPAGRHHDSGGKVVADWNHQFHPRATFLQATPIEIAMRNSRVQWMHRDTHTKEYHRLFYGPRKPETLEKAFSTVIFAAAGYIPDYAIQTNPNGTYYQKPLSDDEKVRYWKEGLIRPYSAVAVRDGILDYVLNNSLGGINERTIDEFINTPSQQRKFELGSTILGAAIYDVSNPFTKLYRLAKQEGNIPPAAPRTISRQILCLVGGRRRSRALGRLEERLRVAA